MKGGCPIPALALVLWLPCPWAGATCLVDVEALSFPDYDPRQASPTDGEGRLTVWCEDRTPLRLTLHPGAGGRALRGPARLPYQIYLDAARTRPWGDGSDGEALLHINPGRRESHTLYGRIPPAQNVPAGDYADLITVVVEF